MFGMKLYIISIASFFGNVSDLNSLLNSMQKPAMLLLEDLDTARLQNRRMLRVSTAGRRRHAERRAKGSRRCGKWGAKAARQRRPKLELSTGNERESI